MGSSALGHGEEGPGHPDPREAGPELCGHSWFAGGSLGSCPGSLRSGSMVMGTEMCACAEGPRCPVLQEKKALQEAILRRKPKMKVPLRCGPQAQPLPKGLANGEREKSRESAASGHRLPRSPAVPPAGQSRLRRKLPVTHG